MPDISIKTLQKDPKGFLSITHAASCKMKEALNTKRNPRDEDNFTLNLSAVNIGLTRSKIKPLWQNIVSQFLEILWYT